MGFAPWLAVYAGCGGFFVLECWVVGMCAYRVCARGALARRALGAVLPDCSAHAGAWAPQSVWVDRGGRVSDRLRTAHTSAAVPSGALSAPGLQIFSVPPILHFHVPMAVTRITSFP